MRRIICLGSLGDDADPKLSPHLRSRHEVGRILRSTGIETIEFRAGMVIGSGSLSYTLMKSLTDRLATVEVSLPLPALPTPHAGVYALELLCGDVLLGSHRVRIVPDASFGGE